MAKLMDRHPKTGKFVPGRPVGLPLPVPREVLRVDQPKKVDADLMRSALMKKAR